MKCKECEKKIQGDEIYFGKYCSNCALKHANASFTK